MNSSSSDLFFTDTDPLIVNILSVVARVTNSKGIDQWFEFGLQLGLSVPDLTNIGMTGRGPLDCGREALLLWRSNNISQSHVPIITALYKVGREDLADSISKTFSTSQVADSSKFIVMVSNG